MARHPKYDKLYPILYAASQAARVARYGDIKTRDAKACTACKVDIPLRGYSRDKSNHDGLSARCKRCDYQKTKAYRLKKRLEREAQQVKAIPTIHKPHLVEILAYNGKSTVAFKFLMAFSEAAHAQSFATGFQRTVKRNSETGGGLFIEDNVPTSDVYEMRGGVYVTRLITYLAREGIDFTHVAANWFPHTVINVAKARKIALDDPIDLPKPLEAVIAAKRLKGSEWIKGATT